MMPRAGVVIVGLMALFLTLFPKASIAKQGKHCPPSSCGNLHNISYPFRLKSDPSKCGHHSYELACENNHTTLIMSIGKFYVQEISYVNKTMRLVDSSLSKNTCSIPVYSLTEKNFWCLGKHWWNPLDNVLVFMNCITPLNSSLYVDATPCINISSSSSKTYSYATNDLSVSDIHDLCSIQVVVPVPVLFSNIKGLSIFEIHPELLRGFEISWEDDGYCSSKIPLNERVIDYLNFLLYPLVPIVRHPIRSLKIICGLFIGRTSLGIVCLIAMVVYKFRRRHLSVDDTIEEFLQSHNNFVPIRYSYSEIKEMTKYFKDKLGQGGYGSVYKGKLRSGQFVAIKVLSKSKANGQDFISEIATIGRIYHVNVVRLIGFCVEGSKRALIFDFMVNGSLDKFIFHEREQTNPLSWDKTYEIGLGVA